MKKIEVYLITLLLLSNIHGAQLSDIFRVDGYTDLLVEQDEQKDKYSVTGGFQGRLNVTENLSATAHLYFYNEDEVTTKVKNFVNETKWIYLDYYLGDNYNIRGGKFQFPIFTSSETGNIGFTNTWTEPPLRYYGAFGYDDFEGAELLKNFFYDENHFLLQLSYGKSENELPIRDGDTIEGKADSIYGITLKNNHPDFHLNIGYFNAQTEIELPMLEDSELGKTRTLDFEMFALEGEYYFNDLTGKIGLIDAKVSDVFADELRYYLSFEYDYENFTPYIYYANEEYKSSNFSKIDKRYSIGNRYEINNNFAVKFSITDEKSEDRKRQELRDSDRRIYTGTLNVIF